MKLVKKLSYVVLFGFLVSVNISHSDDDPHIVFDPHSYPAVIMKDYSLRKMTVRQKRRLAFSKGRTIRVLNFGIKSMSYSEYIQGGPFYLFNMFPDGRRIVCALRGDEADREADYVDSEDYSPKLRRVTISGEVFQYTLETGLIIDPCRISEINE